MVKHKFRRKIDKTKDYKQVMSKKSCNYLLTVTNYRLSKLSPLTQLPTSDENRPHNVFSQFRVFFSKYTIKYFPNKNRTQLLTSDENRRRKDEEYFQDISNEYMIHKEITKSTTTKYHVRIFCQFLREPVKNVLADFAH